MESKAISQKEYLKKYISLGNGDEKKKKKKKKLKTGTKTVKVIDDDIDLKNMRPIEEGEFDILLDGEDAPQIAGIVDERGPVDFTDKRRWKIITENEEGNLTIINRPADKEKRNRDDEMNVEQNKNDNLDLSPPRSKHSKNKHIDSNLHGQSKDDDSDLSPPRQSMNNNSSSVRQSKNYNSDASPPRRITKHRTSDYNTSERKYRSLGNKDSDSDFSPPRKRKPKLDTDLYENKKNKKDRDPDLDTFRRKEHRSRRDNSPHSSSRRVDKEYNYYDKNLSRSNRQDIPRSNKDKSEREYEDRDRRSRSYADTKERRKKSRWNDETDDFEREHSESHSRDRNDRMTKTLDGKTAGLQDAKALREETEAHKRREIEQFNKLSKTVSGVGQAPIMRDKTGRKRNLEAEAVEKREREARQLEIDEKYNKWGKGLKQVEDREEKLKDDLYEMNKPLARYADDADLDKQLREQEREGDPMLEYIKQKQIKEGKRQPEQLQYQGSYAPNRFGIKPGHRWDGVDRSNGYEKKWFETQNAKVARQEDAYKWSTSDM